MITSSMLEINQFSMYRFALFTNLIKPRFLRGWTELSKFGNNFKIVGFFIQSCYRGSSLEKDHGRRLYQVKW